MSLKLNTKHAILIFYTLDAIEGSSEGGGLKKCVLKICVSLNFEACTMFAIHLEA